jgi:hypothetical protein
MSDKQLFYLDELVRKAFNGYASDGDQDRDLLRQIDFTPEEISDLSLEYVVFNGNSEDYKATLFTRLPESCAATFLYYKFRNYLKGLHND